MNRIFHLIFCVLSFVSYYGVGQDLRDNSPSQKPEWKWVNSIQGDGQELIKSSDITPNGNLVVAGIRNHQFNTSFHSQNHKTSIQNGNPDQYFLKRERYHGRGKCNFWLTKYNSEGNLLWNLEAKATGAIFPEEVKVAKDGSIYVTGGYGGRAIFQASNGQQTVVESAMDTNGNYYPRNEFSCFLAKYDPNGLLLWVRVGIGQGSVTGKQINFDSSGNAYLRAGCRHHNIAFGNFILKRPGDGSSYYFDINVKYDPSGQELWLNYMDHGGYTRVNKNDQLEIYPFNYGWHQIFSTQEKSHFIKAPTWDTKLRKLVFSKNGILLSNNEFLPSLASTASIHQIKQDASGNYIVLLANRGKDLINPFPAGTHPNYLQFNGIQHHVKTPDLFLAKFNSDETPKWLIKMTSARWVYHLDLDVVQYDILVTGIFHDEMEITDVTEISRTIKTNVNGSSFVCEIGSNGHFKWLENVGNFRGAGSHIQVSAKNKQHIFIAEDYNLPVRLDQFQLNVEGGFNEIYHQGDNPIDMHFHDAFVAKLSVSEEDSTLQDNNTPILTSNTSIRPTIYDLHQSDLMVYPNPNPENHDGMNLQLNTPNEGILDWKLVDGQGKSIKNGKSTLKKGWQTKILKMGALTFGRYILKVTFNGITSHRQIIIAE